MAQTLKLHPSSLVYILICSLGVIAFFIVGIYPNFEAMLELDDNIGESRVKVTHQELLFPVYSQLMKEVQRRPPSLPLPTNTNRQYKSLSQIKAEFRSLAEKNNITLESMTPDAASYLEESGLLTLNLVFRGDFFNCQNLLLDICQVPFLLSIDVMRISTHNNGKEMRLKVQLDQN